MARATPKEFTLTESQRSASLNLVPFFTKTPKEQITYAIEVVPPSFAAQVTVNRETGALSAQHSGNMNPPKTPNTRIVSGTLVTSFTIQAFAVNQFNKRSPPLSIPVTETVVAPPVFLGSASNSNWPKEVYIHNNQPTIDMNLTQFFIDPQELPLIYEITQPSPVPNTITLSRDGKLKITAAQRTQQLTLMMRITNGKKEIMQSLLIVEEFVQPPQLVTAFSATYSINPIAPLQLTLPNHFREPAANQTLRATGGNPSLAFSITGNPASAMTATLSGGNLTITSKNQDARFTVTVRATNAYGLSTTSEFTIQDVKNVDCKVSDWSDWGACNKSCGGGTRTRTRIITTQSQGAGVSCSTFPLTESQSCNTHTCDVDCIMGDWSQWSQCRPCGEGTITRSRPILQQSRGNGRACGATTESQSCNNGPCSRYTVTFFSQPNYQGAMGTYSLGTVGPVYFGQLGSMSTTYPGDVFVELQMRTGPSGWIASRSDYSQFNSMFAPYTYINIIRPI